MPQTQDQVKTQQFRVMVEGVADDLAAHASFAEETMVHRGWVDVEVVRRAQRQLQQALDAYQSETREAGPDLLDALKIVCACGEPEKVSLYDEEGVEGWRWTHPDGREWTEIGSWDEDPPMHPVAEAALKKATP